ncbi:bifunctional threonine ammonia-lyase/L-serine ammonia-lyase TdcB [Streptococcus phocae subsp. phocae]|uniref:L-threonine dehydratase catabolic TdcB n=1 Tax=Streptococcus phocae TaxID=119224 RepID=A0A0N8FX24_9STRE|nr:bifunctional threonine ammonia-lyase/L-serine ammonia-lyase TdcB [Streptococcus phocae]KGR72107.1 threonine dehydratase [Streptococcus phocae subsp. salmonis]KPJ21939.1 threonine dehydratase [Streptococcus phocae]
MTNLANLPITIKDIKKAQNTVKQYARETPLIQSMFLTAKTGGEVYLKLENMQLTGSFKFRGAFNKIAQLSQEEKDRGVIACSAGNHAQGVALTSKLLGIKSIIVMPKGAPQAKVDATRGYGAEVMLEGDQFDDSKAFCEAYAKEHNITYIPPYDDTEVMAGQGTIGLEILEHLWDVDTILVPVGGGGLISGVAVALKSFNPNIQIIGVQAENCHGMTASFRERKKVHHDEAPTIADGCHVAYPGELTFEVVNQIVDNMVLVTESEIELAIKDLIQRTKIVVEGAGALPTAAILAGKVDEYVKGKKVVSIVSGGNVDLARIEDVVDHFLIANDEEQ